MTQQGMTDYVQAFESLDAGHKKMLHDYFVSTFKREPFFGGDYLCMGSWFSKAWNKVKTNKLLNEAGHIVDPTYLTRTAIKSLTPGWNKIKTNKILNEAGHLADPTYLTRLAISNATRKKTAQVSPARQRLLLLKYAEMHHFTPAQTAALLQSRGLSGDHHHTGHRHTGHPITFQVPGSPGTDSPSTTSSTTNYPPPDDETTTPMTPDDETTSPMTPDDETTSPMTPDARDAGPGAGSLGPAMGPANKLTPLVPDGHKKNTKMLLIAGGAIILLLIMSRKG